MSELAIQLNTPFTRYLAARATNKKRALTSYFFILLNSPLLSLFLLKLIFEMLPDIINMYLFYYY